MNSGGIYNVLIIGAGKIASGYDTPMQDKILTHAHALVLATDFNLLGFYDVDQQKAEIAAKKWGVGVIRDLASIKNQVDVVCCAVPDEFHYDIMKRIIELPRLKMAICEKPITRNLVQAQEMVELYKRREIPLIVNYTRRFLNEFIELKNWINEAGDLKVGNCFYGKGVFHNCSHMINTLEYLFGELEFLQTNYMMYDYFQDDPSVSFILKRNSANIYFHPIECNIVTVFEFDLLFAKGRIKYSDAEGKIKYYKVDESEIYDNELNYVLERIVEIDWNSALTTLYKNVGDVLRKQVRMHSSGEDAYKTICICDKVKKDAMVKNDERFESSCYN